MKQRILAVAVALGVGAAGCGTGGQHRDTLPLVVLVGGVFVGAIILAATHQDDNACLDPAGRCAGTQYPSPPETR